MLSKLCLGIALIALAAGAPLSGSSEKGEDQVKSKQDSNGPEALYQLLGRMQKTADIISLTASQLKHDLSGHVPHAIHKRQATQLTMNAYSPPDSSSATGTLGLSHTMGGGGGGGGTTFGGQFGASTDGDTSWGLNVGHDTGSTNFGANVGGDFAGNTNWGATAGGSLGEGLDWSATAGGEVGGATDWGLGLDQTWQHQGGASSSLGAWVQGGEDGPAGGIKYILNL